MAAAMIVLAAGERQRRAGQFLAGRLGSTAEDRCGVSYTQIEAAHLNRSLIGPAPGRIDRAVGALGGP